LLQLNTQSGAKRFFKTGLSRFPVATLRVKEDAAQCKMLLYLCGVALMGGTIDERISLFQKKIMQVVSARPSGLAAGARLAAAFWWKRGASVDRTGKLCRYLAARLSCAVILR
jgi:hypothetical protein